MASGRRLVVEILGDAKGLAGAVRESDGALSKLGSGIAGFAKTAAVGFAAAGVGAIALSKPLIGAASDLQESLGKSSVVFGENAKEIEAWSKTSAKAFGLSQQQALEASGTYGNLFQAFGVGRQESTKMSKSLVELAADLASFNNTSVDDALQALQSGLSGEAEPLKKFGVALTDARLKEEAMSMGLIKSTKDALTPAAKSQAAYSLIMKDSTLAQGDFARTSDGLANKQRILSAQFKDVQAQIGTALLPAALSIATLFTERVIPAVQRLWEQLRGPLTEAFQSVSRFATEQLLPAVREVFGWLRDNVPPVLAAVAGFINDRVVPAIQGLIGWVRANLLPALGELWRSFEENILPTLQKLASFVVDRVLPVLAAIGQWIVEHVLPIVGKLVVFIIGDLIPAFFKVVAFITDKVIPAFAGVAVKIGEVVSSVWGFLTDVWRVFGDVVTFISELPGKIAGAASGMWDGIKDAFKAVINWIIDAWNALDFTLPSVDTHIPGVGRVGGFTLGTPDIRRLHTGGTYRSPTPGGVGLALLRDGERVLTPGAAGGGGMTIVVQTLNPTREAGRTVLDALNDELRRRGRPTL